MVMVMTKFRSVQTTQENMYLSLQNLKDYICY